MENKLKVEYVDIDTIKPYKNNAKYFVYMHLFPNNKVYIGITKFKPEYRWNNGEGYKRQPYIYKAIQKYGWNNIEHIILENNLDERSAKLKEKQYIKLYNSNNKKHGYNLTEGGEGTVGYHLTEKHIRKIIECNHTRIFKEESKEKLRKANLGKKASKETKEKMSKCRRGKDNHWFGKKHSQETKNKISFANSGFNSKKSIHIAKYDMNKNLIEIYGSLRNAENYGYNRMKYQKKLNEIDYIECGGYLWKKVK